MITGNHRPKQASNLPEGHDEVPEPDERAVRVREEADHHVTVQHGHRRLVPVLGRDIINKYYAISGLG